MGLHTVLLYIQAARECAMHDGGDMNAAPSYAVLALPEMLDAIFSYLHPPSGWDKGRNREALHACSLVNRAWSAAAFPHVWTAVSFSIGPTHVDDADSEGPVRSLEVLHEFFTSSVDIRNAVRSLRLVSGSGFYRLDISPTLLDSIFRLLPNLRHIVLDAVCQRLLDAPRTHDLPLLSVSSIELRGDMRGRKGSPENLLALTSMFAQVGELKFVDFWLASIGKISSPPQVTQISKIDFASPHFVPDLLSVLRNFDTRHLTSLSVAFSHIADDAEVRDTFFELLAAIGPTLTEIGIRLNDRYDTTTGEKLL